MSQLEQVTIKKEQVIKNIHPELKFKVDKDKKYKMKAIQNNTVYTNKSKSQLPRLYYLIS